MPTKEDSLINLNTYILTIDGSYRTKELISRLEMDDLNPKSVLGIDGRNKSKHFFKNIRHDYLSWFTLGRSLTNEEIACALGHRMIYELIHENKSDWALICEDDAVPLENLSHFTIQKIVNEVENGTNCEDVDQPRIIHLGSTLLGEQDTIVYSSQLETNKISNAPLCAHAYLINKCAVEVIRSHPKSSEFINPCDWPIQWKDKIIFYRVVNALFNREGDDKSYIAPQRIQSELGFMISRRIEHRMRTFLAKIGITAVILRRFGFSG